MSGRAMIVVAGGSSSRFGTDKLMMLIAGQPLVFHTVSAVNLHVDQCVLVCRPDQVGFLSQLGLDARVVVGGPTRTRSEMAGLAALSGQPDLIGIHDGARPVVSSHVIEALFEAASRVGGAVPVLDPDGPLVSRSTLIPTSTAKVVQTPQVFRRATLIAAYEEADETGFEGHDTADVVQHFADQPIAAVPGDPDNVKVTYPEDLEKVSVFLEASSRSEPG